MLCSKSGLEVKGGYKALTMTIKVRTLEFGLYSMGKKYYLP